MNGIAKENSLRSISLYALSSIDITFDQDTDRQFARQQVFNRIGDLSLPSGVTPSVSPLTSPSGLIYRYTLQSPDRSPTELKTFEDWVVEPQYRSVSGSPTIPASAAERWNIKCCSTSIASLEQAFR